MKMGGISKLAVAVSPAMVVFISTVAISLALKSPEGLFLAHSREHILARFLLITAIFAVSVEALPKFLPSIAVWLRRKRFFGQLVKAKPAHGTDFSKTITWMIRPLQGIGLSMIFAQRLLNLFEVSAGASYVSILLRPTLFMVSTALVALLLSVVWTLDDLGGRIYNEKTGEVHMTGSTIGVVLPIVFGALGLYSLFQISSPAIALVTVIEIAMVLYPPYVLLAVIHHRLVSVRGAKLESELRLRSIETRVL
ncbi:MAG: hypothetical protein HYY68_08035 [Thaumarchaeota archaeon]|nr:hypothetical protein [Nitrososphaerota archaeon]